MHHRKLVQLMKTNSDRVADSLILKIRRSERCKELMQRLPEQEQKQYSMGVYRDLTDWLASETDSIIEERYIALGVRRAQLGVPFSDLFWAVCIARECLWDYVEQECMLEEPTEFWGGMKLLRLSNKFFDRALYFVLLGYQKGC